MCHYLVLFFLCVDDAEVGVLKLRRPCRASGTFCTILPRAAPCAASETPMLG